jgi:hypothetical protein
LRFEYDTEFQQPKRLARLKQNISLTAGGKRFQQPKRLARLKPPALFPVLNQELKQLSCGRVKSASAMWLGRSVSGRNIAENDLRIKPSWQKIFHKMITD